jgi:hypothetical protein
LAQSVGEVLAGSGHFGAMQVVAEIQARFQAPAGGGRSTDPTWTDRRLVPLFDRQSDTPASCRIPNLASTAPRVRYDQPVLALPSATIGIRLDIACWVAALTFAANDLPRVAIGFGVMGIALAVVAGVADEKARKLRRRSKI